MTGAYLAAIGRDSARVGKRERERVAGPLAELAGRAEPAEIEHCTRWLKSEPFYRDQGKAPSPEQVVRHYPGWVELGRPERWTPPARASPNGRPGRYSAAQLATDLLEGNLTSDSAQALDVLAALQEIAPELPAARRRPG